MRTVLPALQVAIAVFLLVGAGLLLRSFGHLWSLNPGFDASNVVTATFSLRDARYSAPWQVSRLFDETLRRLHAVAGVESAAVAMTLPYERGVNSVFFNPTSADPSAYRLANFVSVSPEFFSALRIPLMRGRLLSDSDQAESARVIVVNEAFARQNFRDREAVGAEVKLSGKDSESTEIVGVVGDTQQRAGWGSFGPMGQVPTIYLPAAQGMFSVFSSKWIVRTRTPDGSIQRRIEEAVKSVDPLLPIASFQTLEEVKTSAFAWQEFLAATIGIAAALALTLSIIGTYAMISNSVVERTREFGIRMALGATIGQTVRAAARPGLICATVGLIAGLVAARLEHKLLEGLVWGVTTTDTITFLLVPIAVLMVAAIASIVPALRISGLDPAQTLRQE